ncbi:hypothetical protein GIB67_028353 [Kingdonia uniflora]|uniref:Replication protein A 70 kDa DNA-binding subunit B/D first OB fold domain-containing protein n=1 Tax=Kingdonia uniflora TaxID=39325 RepID=A0A7J7MHZ1_9MAGN|nr:hypothetical protein GIB67_028353 [Kingdonia uniflora]
MVATEPKDEDWKHASRLRVFKFIEPRLTYGTIGGRFKKGENLFVEEAYRQVALDQLQEITDAMMKSFKNSIFGLRTTNTLLNSQSIIEVGKHLFIGIKQMKAYNHFDRVRFSYCLNPKRVQDVICKGSCLYDMLPEEYTFKDIIGKWHVMDFRDKTKIISTNMILIDQRGDQIEASCPKMCMPKFSRYLREDIIIEMKNGYIVFNNGQYAPLDNKLQIQFQDKAIIKQLDDTKDIPL